MAAGDYNVCGGGCLIVLCALCYTCESVCCVSFAQISVTLTHTRTVFTYPEYKLEKSIKPPLGISMAVKVRECFCV